ESSGRSAADHRAGAGSCDRPDRPDAMSQANDLLQQAVAMHRSGRLAEAEAIYRKVLAANPNDADALQLLGAIAHQLDRYGASIELIRRSLAIVPTGRQP